VTLEQALALLAQPKRGRSAGRAKVEPLKTFEASPATGRPIELRDGRYGPYVTDGETNASLPRDVDPENVTQDLAVRLLAERAARGPRKKTSRRRAAGKKKAPRKKTSRKKTSRKKAPPERPEPS
jgi:DNA topoisomerase-1